MFRRPENVCGPISTFFRKKWDCAYLGSVRLIGGIRYWPVPKSEGVPSIGTCGLNRRNTVKEVVEVQEARRKCTLGCIFQKFSEKRGVWLFGICALYRRNTVLVLASSPSFRADAYLIQHVATDPRQGLSVPHVVVQLHTYINNSIPPHVAPQKTAKCACEPRALIRALVNQ